MRLSFLKSHHTTIGFSYKNCTSCSVGVAQWYRAWFVYQDPGFHPQHHSREGKGKKFLFLRDA
jgi:hypothetical protein